MKIFALTSAAGLLALLLHAQPAASAEKTADIQILIADQNDAGANPLPSTPAIKDVVGLLAAETGLRLAVHSYPWRRAQVMAANGEGMLLGAAETPARARVFSFTKSLYSVNQWLVSPADAPVNFQRWEDLRGKVISIMSGGKYSPEFEQYRNKLFTVEENATTIASRMNMLSAKRVDAILIDSYRSAPLLAATLNCTFGGKWVVAEKPVDTEPVLIAVPRASPLHRLLPTLNEGIDRLTRSRSIQKVLENKSNGSTC